MSFTVQAAGAAGQSGAGQYTTCARRYTTCTAPHRTCISRQMAARSQHTAASAAVSQFVNLMFLGVLLSTAQHSTAQHSSRAQTQQGGKKNRGGGGGGKMGHQQGWAGLRSQQGNNQAGMSAQHRGALTCPGN